MKPNILFDPLQKHNQPKRYILVICGLIPLWLVDEANFGLIANEVFEKEYTFGVYEMTGGQVDEDGVYYYPEDPPLYPYYAMTRGKETIYQYEYGIVSIIREDGSQFITRLD